VAKAIKEMRDMKAAGMMYLVMYSEKSDTPYQKCIWNWRVAQGFHWLQWLP